MSCSAASSASSTSSGSRKASSVMRLPTSIISRSNALPRTISAYLAALAAVGTHSLGDRRDRSLGDQHGSYDRPLGVQVVRRDTGRLRTAPYLPNPPPTFHAPRMKQK